MTGTFDGIKDGDGSNGQMNILFAAKTRNEYSIMRIEKN